MSSWPLSPDLFTKHAVCVGQSGSGKTGLYIAILESLALERIPILALDLKGDITNLKLVFPALSGADLLPLVDPADAHRQRTTPEALADRWAASWRAGQHADGIDDLQRWHDTVDVQILTPGSDLAPVDVVSALTTCPPDLDDEGRRDWIVGAVAALLGLVELPADPVNDPPAILLAQLFTDAFAAGESLPFDVLLPRILRPPFERLGLFPVDEVIPPKNRQSLALRLNHLVASPAFAPWRTGVPLDLNAWLRPVDGKTPVRVLTLAHLPDPQRMFFITLFLHAVIAWKRSLPGTSHLRAALCFDEVQGYLPPHPQNPPSKAPIVTLIKQARAYGFGVLLATQNPMDIDYKILSNAGTWLIGRLQTENDRERVLEGMAGDRATLERTILGLQPRHFLTRLPDGSVRVLRSPHTRSVLRGPLTIVELRRLLDPTWTALRPGAVPAAHDRTSGPPPMPAGLSCAWLGDLPADASARLRERITALGSDLPDHVPALYARLTARVRDGDEEVVRTRHRLWLRPDRPPISVPLPDAALLPTPAAGSHALLPAGIDTDAELSAWKAAVHDEYVRGLVVSRQTGPGVTAALGEPEAAVAARHPGVPLRAVPHRPRPRDVVLTWFGVVWLPTSPPAKGG